MKAVRYSSKSKSWKETPISSAKLAKLRAQHSARFLKDGTPKLIGRSSAQSKRKSLQPALGYKPLYWDPWGAASAFIRSELRRALPSGTTIDASDAGLLVFQPDVVRPLLDSDPAFYGSHGKSILPAVRNVSRIGSNGELLGYGARSFAMHQEPFRSESSTTNPNYSQSSCPTPR